jgi:hypothetical protein
MPGYLLDTNALSIHGLTVVTANARHFKHFGVAFISPLRP